MIGETISLTVAALWTFGALFGELASKRLGAQQLNVIRMVLSLMLLGTALWFMVGHPYPYQADGKTWLWMGLSGLMGFGLGDYFLFNSYVIIGSRFSQLFMTLASPFAALTAWLMLGEQMTWVGLLGMTITIVGIGLSVLARGEKEERKKGNVRGNFALKLPIKGVLFGIGAGLGQGVGLVLSKIGLEHYTASATLSPGMSPYLYPVGGTMIRATVGLVCFLVLLMAKGEVHKMRASVQNRRGMGYALMATLAGPTIGVSLSLLAVQYASAGVAQTIMSLTPILIIWPSHVVFKTRVTPMEVIGAIIAVLGVTLFFI